MISGIYRYPAVKEDADAAPAGAVVFLVHRGRRASSRVVRRVLCGGWRVACDSLRTYLFTEKQKNIPSSKEQSDLIPSFWV